PLGCWIPVSEDPGSGSAPLPELRCGGPARGPVRRTLSDSPEGDPEIPSEGFPSFRALRGLPRQRWRQGRGGRTAMQVKMVPDFRESVLVFRDCALSWGGARF